MKKILFVDDEPRILDGLRRSLRHMRQEWDMHFAHGGQMALNMLGAAAFDVIVTDMKMPGIDGTALLSEVKRLHPHTIRIILSGHAETASVIEAAAHVHLYLTKPCNPAEIKQAVDRTNWLEQLLDNKQLADIASQMAIVPSSPSAYARICQELSRDDCSPTDITAIIAGDVGMYLSVLKLVNSAFFGAAGSVTCIERAVALLGTDTMRSLVKQRKLFEPCQADGAHAAGIDALNARCALTARLAARIATHHGLNEGGVDDAFTSGALHGVGTLLVAARLPRAYTAYQRAKQHSARHSADIERKIFGATRAEIGAYLIGLWGLPDRVVTAIAFHENPRRDTPDSFGIAGMLHVATRLAREPDANDIGRDGLDLDVDYLRVAGVLEHWPHWREAARACAAEGVPNLKHCG